ncbi:AraC family transcriptional regulator [Tepidibacillus decaturensis]|nr:AraC family transcriptional regulator [Tepidibacillus decaturensis]
MLFHFCNQSYYSSLFKKYTGLTPKKFRNMNSNIR